MKPRSKFTTARSKGAPDRRAGGFVHKGQAYLCVGTTEGETRAGRSVKLMVLATDCPICGAPFTLTASRRQIDQRIVLRRCERHRERGLTVERHRELLSLGSPRLPASSPDDRGEWRPEPIPPAATSAFARLAASYDPASGIRRRDFVALLPDVPERQAARWWRRYVYRHLVLAPDGRWQPRRSAPLAASAPVALDVPAGVLQAFGAERRAAISRVLE